MSARLDHRLLEAVELIRRGAAGLDDYGYLSTSEWIVLCLAIGTREALADLQPSYSTLTAAWARLDAGQRATVLHAWEN